MTSEITPHHQRLKLIDVLAEQLSSQFGTPLYVLSEGHIRSRARQYMQAMQDAFPRGTLCYAAKANSTLAVLKILDQEGLFIDVASGGEFASALAAGVKADRCVFHGNNKSRDELEYAIGKGIGQIVVDNFEEIDQLIDLQTETKLVIRLAPGVDVDTHQKIQTGQTDSKFGFNISDGSAEQAVLRMSQAGLNLVGCHSHIGSQVFDQENYKLSAEILIAFATDMQERYKLFWNILNIGGGLGVSYDDSVESPDIVMFSQEIYRYIANMLRSSGWDPILYQEPGRSLLAESGVTLYTVGVVKKVSLADREKVFVSVDGGFGDNPRPGLYGSHYPLVFHAQGNGQGLVTICGRHCEPDILFPDVPAPNLQRGDLVQVLCTGAYNSSMASNYNRYPRPSTVLIRENGEVQLVQSRETIDEMLSREILPEL